jgi:hypothetical protein
VLEPAELRTLMVTTVSELSAMYGVAVRD